MIQGLQHAAETTVDSGMLERVGGDRELLAEVITLFLEDGPALIEAMRQGLRDDDYTAVRMAAHSLAGSAGNFDATPVTALARQLEARALAQDVPASRVAFAQLENGVTRLLVHLTDIRAAL